MDNSELLSEWRQMKQDFEALKADFLQLSLATGNAVREAASGKAYGVQPKCPYCNQSTFSSESRANFSCSCHNCGNAFWCNAMTGITYK